MKTSEEIKTAIMNYIAKVQEQVDENFKTQYTSLYKTELHPKIEVMFGSKFARIIETTASQKSSFCFIDMVTGDILKSAGWKAPAKGVRGNIFNDKFPVTLGQMYRYR